MARLSGPLDRTLDLEPVSYELPDLDMPWDGEDANWVNVRITVTDGTRQWTATGPYFETWDLRALVQWCCTLAAGQEPPERVFAVVEPCLQLEALDASDELRLRALFQLEYRPPGLPFVPPKDSPAEADVEDVLLEFRPGAAGLAAFAAALEAELQRFPIRLQPRSG
jgi:hypothetical protein